MVLSTDESPPTCASLFGRCLLDGLSLASSMARKMLAKCRPSYPFSQPSHCRLHHPHSYLHNRPGCNYAPFSIFRDHSKLQCQGVKSFGNSLPPLPVAKLEWLPCFWAQQHPGREGDTSLPFLKHPFLNSMTVFLELCYVGLEMTMSQHSPLSLNFPTSMNCWVNVLQMSCLHFI